MIKLSTLLLVGILITGCSNPTSSVDIDATVEAIFEATVEARSRQNTPTATPQTIWMKPLQLPPTNTPIPPTNTPIPPTNTPAPPTNTPIPPTNTPIPPTSTPIPPTSTPAPTKVPKLILNEDLGDLIPLMTNELEENGYDWQQFGEYFQSTHTGTVVRFVGSIHPDFGSPGYYCLVTDNDYISDIGDPYITPLVVFYTDTFESEEDANYSYVELEGLVTGFLSVWGPGDEEDYPCARNADMALIVEPSSVELIDRSDVVPAVISAEFDSKVNQWGVSAEVAKIDLAHDELRIHLNFINNWEVNYDPGVGDNLWIHDQLLLEYPDAVIRGLGIDILKKISVGLHRDCEDFDDSNFVGCKEFRPGTKTEMVYLFRDAAVSKILSGDITKFNIRLPSKENTLPFRRGVRDFIWEVNLDNDSELLLTNLTEDLSTLPILQMDLVEINDTFDRNRFTFITNYQGRRFQISGIIDSIRSTYSDDLPRIELGLNAIRAAKADANRTAGIGLGSYSYKITCDFNDPAAIYELEKGQPVTLVGLYTGDDLALVNCELFE